LIICYYLFKEMASPRIPQRVLQKSWFSYVDGEREKEGMSRCLPGGRHTKTCCCKSGTSSPLAALLPLRGNRPTPMSLGPVVHRSQTVSLVERSCPSLRQSSSERLRQKRGRVDCEGLCERVIRINDSICLCCCLVHREECPIHHCC
jgi:hypothetical protein